VAKTRGDKSLSALRALEAAANLHPMWGRDRKAANEAGPGDTPSAGLKDAVRKVRIEIAERSSVVVDLRDAEFARLELLNDALDPLFAETPPDIDLFDRGISKGDTPRLWIDAISHVAMAHDKRRYRFVQDTRYGRKVLAESNDIPEIVGAVTHYVAARMIERERAMAEDESPLHDRLRRSLRGHRPHRRWRLFRVFMFGLVAGCAALFTVLWIVASRMPH
jgi:hypothetical protein